ncbi:MAG: hypothetical protein JHC98_02465 [Thermoleophilaceae bacterium]|nr:hypothetical protein [Thermoleophilaceae bacterium]
MSNIAYETLGRVTWAVGKRQVRSALMPKRKSRGKRAVLVLGVVVLGVIVAGAALERAAAQ